MHRGGRQLDETIRDAPAAARARRPRPAGPGSVPGRPVAARPGAARPATPRAAANDDARIRLRVHDCGFRAVARARAPTVLPPVGARLGSRRRHFGGRRQLCPARSQRRPRLAGPCTSRPAASTASMPRRTPAYAKDLPGEEPCLLFLVTRTTTCGSCRGRARTSRTFARGVPRPPVTRSSATSGRPLPRPRFRAWSRSRASSSPAGMATPRPFAVVHPCPAGQAICRSDVAARLPRRLRPRSKAFVRTRADIWQRICPSPTDRSRAAKRSDRLDGSQSGYPAADGHRASLSR